MNNIFRIIKWAVSIIFLLGSLGGFANGQVLPAIFIALIGIALLPPFISYLEKKLLTQIKWWMQLIVIFVLFIGFSITAGTSKTANSNLVNPPQPSGIQTQATITTATPTSTAPATTVPTTQSTVATTQDATKVNAEISVHFIDVGQADSILIKANSAAMLIDAGNNADGNTVVSYIKQQGILKLDYVIGTHPHEDHIGGMDNVIRAYDIGKVIMPKASSNTKTFEDVLTALSSKGLKVTSPIPGTTYSIGDAKFTIFAPNSSSYEDLNNYSVVVKLTYGKTSFLLEGDAGDVSESEMLRKEVDLKSDVLKVGHHLS